MSPRRSVLKTMIVMAIITVLVSVAIPIYSRILTRSKESILKNYLFTLRTVIQEYTHDMQKAPETLGDLLLSIGLIGLASTDQSNRPTPFHMRVVEERTGVGVGNLRVVTDNGIACYTRANGDVILGESCRD